MDMTWVTDRLAVGGAIWVREAMAEVAAAGVSHVLDLQAEFDDTELGRQAGIVVLWNPLEDDWKPKPAAAFRRGVQFARMAFADPRAKLLVHCTAGVHRAPMMALAILGTMGYRLGEAKRLIAAKRDVADFVEVYVKSVEAFLQVYAAEGAEPSRKDDNGRR